MTRPIVSFILVLITCISVGFGADGSISGLVKAEVEIPLSEMAVYLEPVQPSASTTAQLKPIQVSQKGAQFSPGLLVIAVGQTVEFLNDEDRLIEHNVFSNAPAKRFDLGLYRPGENRSVTFDKPGPVFLYCSIHRYMDGVIFVAPTPCFSKVSADGKYKIDAVPPGSWILKTWQRRKRLPEITMPLEVHDAQGVNVDLELKRK